MRNGNTKVTIGMDLGDRQIAICVLNDTGAVKERANIGNTAVQIRKYFSQFYPGTVLRIAVETGTHSRWISHLLSQEMGFEVLVGNARRLRTIWDSTNKNDARDAEMLARIARFDPALLYPITHRGRDAHRDLAKIKSRDALVQVRTKLINHIRGTVKAFGDRIPRCGAHSFHRKALDHIPDCLRDTLEPVFGVLEELTGRIRRYEETIEDLSNDRYPETKRLREIAGVGPVTALTFVLTVEDPDRIPKTRSVGSFLGLVPRQDQSGDVDKQLRITKAGNKHLRRLLVGAAQYILGPFGPDCQLRRYGARLVARGGKAAKPRAVVAVARKLAVLMLSLWRHGVEYEPLFAPNHRSMRQAV